MSFFVNPHTFTLCPGDVDIPVNPELDMELSSCFVSCHHCKHAWVYFGSRVASLQKGRKPVTVQCPRCHTRVKLDARNAR